MIRNGHNKEECIHLYRSMQILEKIFNDFVRERVLPAILFCTPAVQVVGMYVGINLQSEIAMPGFLVFPLIGVDAAVCNILVVTMASWIYKRSQKLILLLKKRAARIPSQKALIKRQIRSCSEMRVKFGSNFIDRGTPLVIQNFCINQTMTLTLITAKRDIV
ncbi:Light-independent protochlorophyllide reductase subunit B [Folsomia candida]|uniref:Light-independent protochlorophyllide reductase subunit B n=1 Tax=Folsomia candida TaxID=158441 RepID=A0A226EV38_FOLCA|nr:Light-independent protochlorophyllide reductase subunit B [Folsomia candida]